MSTTTMMGRRWATTGLLAALGGVVTLATWMGGEPYLAVMLGGFYLLFCGVCFLWSRGSGDVAALIRLSGDERQRMIDTRSDRGCRNRHPRVLSRGHGGGPGPGRNRQPLGPDLCRRWARLHRGAGDSSAVGDRGGQTFLRPRGRIPKHPAGERS